MRQDAAAGKPSDAGDPIAFEREHEQTEGVGDRCVCLLDVVAERWLSVRTRRHQPMLLAVPRGEGGRTVAIAVAP
jgi:hypothetical protein